MLIVELDVPKIFKLSAFTAVFRNKLDDPISVGILPSTADTALVI